MVFFILLTVFINKLLLKMSVIPFLSAFLGGNKQNKITKPPVFRKYKENGNMQFAQTLTWKVLFTITDSQAFFSFRIIDKIVWQIFRSRMSLEQSIQCSWNIIAIFLLYIFTNSLLLTEFLQKECQSSQKKEFYVSNSIFSNR